MKKPLLFVSDAISGSSGLGRITRDLATRVHQHLSDVYRVGTVGYGGVGSRKFPWPDYHVHSIDNWLIPELPEVADDFAGGDELTVLYVWDMSRLYWLGTPTRCSNPHLRRFAERKDVKKWAYHAIDAEGPFGKLSHSIAETMKGFDRVLDYSAFSCRITGNTEHLPHGIDTSVFKPQPLQEARTALIKSGFTGLTDKSLLIGIVATNQARKNWQLGMATARILLDRGHDVRLWCHTDVLDRYWSIPNLIVDYGLRDRVAVTTQRFTDAQLASMYSACDVTLGIAPEGFGYPIAESLACGVPCICGSYGAQAEFAPKSMQVEPNAYFYEGAFCSKRPVHSPEAWAFKVEKVLKNNHTGSLLPEHVDWNGSTLWPAWESWFRKGIE
jgi:glycosyltransferase involved in cell wall biosynthesis